MGSSLFILHLKDTVGQRGLNVGIRDLFDTEAVEHLQAGL